MNNVVEELLLDKTVSWFKGKSTPASDKHDSTTTVITKIVMGIAVLVFVAYLTYTSNKKAKELAKARHERDVAIEDAYRDSRKWVLAKTNEEIEIAMVELAKSHERQVELILAAEDLREKHDYEKFKIEAIKNWDDMDFYLNSISTTSPG